MGAVKKIFILHGWAYSTNKWQGVTDFMEKASFSPKILDIPGLTEETEKVWTLDDYVEWLKKKLGGERAILVGHSNGGRIALAFAAKYPERLSHLILIDSAGVYRNGLPIRIKRLFFGTAAILGKKITKSQILRDLLYKAARESDYKNAAPKMRETMANLISTDLTPLLNQVTTPTLIIWGKLDKDTPLSDAKLMHALIKNSELYVISDARHSPQFTHTEEVCRKIAEKL